MSTSSSQLLADIAKLHADVPTLHDIIHGLSNQTVSTEGGPVKTVAYAVQSIMTFTPRGAWATGTAYAFKDLYSDGGVTYMVMVAHTSSTVGADLAAGKVAIYQGNSADHVTYADSNLADSLMSRINRVVNSIAELKALDTTKFTRALVTRYTATEEGGGGYFMWVPDSTRPDNGGNVIAPNSNPATGRWEWDLDEYPVERFGVTPANGANFQAALDNLGTRGGGTLFLRPGANYTVSALSVPSNVEIKCLGGTATITTTSGPVDALTGGRENIVLRNIKIAGQGGLRMGGTTATPTRGFVLDNVDVSCVGLPHCAYFINITGLKIVNRLRVENLGVAPLQYGMYFGVVSNLDADWIDINGNVSMGVETGGNASLDVIPLYRSHIRKLVVRKNDSYTNDNTHHGIYFHGAVDSQIDNVTVIGNWGVGYGLKHRDSTGTRWNRVNVPSLYITSDANSVNINEATNIEMRDVSVTGNFVIFKSAGDVKDVRIHNVTAGDLRSSAAITGPVYVSGKATINSNTDIQMRSITFVDAEVFVPNLNQTTVRFTLGPSFLRSRLKGALYAYNTSITMKHSSVEGLFRHDCSAGTWDLNLDFVDVAGSLFANSFGARVINGNLRNVTFSGAEDANANNNPDVKNYRFVGFADKCYVNQNSVVAV